MVRTQVQLTDEQAAMLRHLAVRNRLSMAEIVRQAIDGYVQRQLLTPDDELRARALAAIGCASGGPTDLSANHDDYAVEAYLE